MLYNGVKTVSNGSSISSNVYFFSFFLVEITVEDQNDNTPVFSNGPTTLPVPNNVQIGKKYLCPDIIEIIFLENDGSYITPDF